MEVARGLTEKVLRDVEEETDVHLHIPIGTMIEVPTGALTAGSIAGSADFFSFGTNDLTQMTWGFSRDDVEACTSSTKWAWTTCPARRSASRSPA